MIPARLNSCRVLLGTPIPAIIMARLSYLERVPLMKPKSILFAALAAVTTLAVMAANARSEEIFVVNEPSTIGKYTTSGVTVNASLVSGLHNPIGIAVSE